jgi:hypothetical protein
MVHSSHVISLILGPVVDMQIFVAVVAGKRATLSFLAAQVVCILKAAALQSPLQERKQIHLTPACTAVAYAVLS